MPHVLHFFAKEEEALDSKLLLSWAARHQHMAAAPVAQGLQLIYKNQDTGVTFSLDHAPDAKIKKLEARLNDCFDTGMELHLDYVLPSFFAREAMSVVDDLAGCFDLLVFDPQERDAKPGPCRIDGLVKSWHGKNDSSIRAMAAKGLMDDVFYMPREKADALWAYSLRKAAYQAQLGETVFVPKILVFVPQARRECVTAIIWNSAHPMVFPVVDHVILLKQDQPCPGSEEEEPLEFAPAAQVRDAIADGLVPFDGNDALSFLSPEQARRHAEAFYRIATKPLDGVFTGIARDRFVDVDFLSEHPRPECLAAAVEGAEKEP